ncbi:MAG TPA: RNA polymerase sigma factor [Mesorhizobium sp.]
MIAMALDQDTASDADLIGLAQGGDGVAFGQLVERHYDFVYRVAYRWCGRKQDAEDVAQEVCIRLAKAIRGYRGGGAFTSWLYAMAMNAARDLGRKSAREKTKTDAFSTQALISTAQAAEADDPVDELWRSVRALPDKQREAVTLVYGEGLSHAAAAEAMAISEATVSWHIHEAKKRLRILMRAAGEV